MLCAISGEVPREPVFSTTTRLIYERSLIEKAISESDKCPVTGEVLSRDSLVSVCMPNQVKAKAAATGTSSVIHSLQKEWDDMTLEVHTLRQQLDLTRKELAQALYQHDAACRVVARLMRERDEALELVRTFQARPVAGNGQQLQHGDAEMEVEAAAQPEPGVGEALLDHLNGVCKTLSTGRKHRKASDQVLPKAQMASSVAEQYKISLFQASSSPVVSCVDSAAAANLEDTSMSFVVAGDSDGTVQLLDMSQRKVVASTQAHTGGVAQVTFFSGASENSHPFLSAGADGVQAWKVDRAGQLVSTYRHKAAATGVVAHPGGQLVLAAGPGSWRMLDLSQGVCLRTVADEANFTATKLHPDGLVLGLGTQSGALSIWDIREQVSVAKLAEHSASILSVDFSENGYLAATGSADGTVKIWDLRKLKCTKSLDLGMSAVCGVKFDFSGIYLGAVGEAQGAGKVSVSVVKDWTEISSQSYSHPLTGISWGPLAHSFVTSAQDGAVVVYGAK